MKTDRKFVSKSGSHAALDRESRISKAKKIVDLLSANYSLQGKKVLDIGTGSGDIAFEISKHVRTVYSIDLFDERVQKAGYKFKQVTGAGIPFKDESFDVVISNHVVEHIPEQELHMKEAMRVLKKRGVLYLATPNKYWLSDPHYKLLFISWLPRKISQKYLNLIRGKNAKWDIYPVSHGWISKHSLSAEVRSAFPAIVKMEIPSEQLGRYNVAKKLMGYLPEPALETMHYISPTLVYLVYKK